MPTRGLQHLPQKRQAVEPRLSIAEPRERVEFVREDSDWDRYVRAILGHRAFILTVTLAGTLLGVLAARRIEPQFVARTVLWIEGSDSDGGQGAGRLLAAPSWMDLLTSGAVLDSVVRSLRLYVTPGSAADVPVLQRFDVGAQPVTGDYELTVSRDGDRYSLRNAGTVVEQGTVGDSIGRALGFRWAPVEVDLPRGGVVHFGVRSPYETTTALAKGLHGTVDAGTSFLRVELRGPDPARTTTTLNAVAARGVSVAAALKRNRMEALERILDEQHRHAEQELRGAERRLADFRVAGVRRLESTESGGTPTSEAALADAAELGGTRDQLRRDRRRLEQLLRSADAAGPALEALAAVPSVADAAPLRVAIEEANKREAELRTLRYRYSDESAPVVEARASLDALTRVEIPALTRALIDALSSREGAIAPRVDAAFGRLRAAPTLAIEEGRLERDLESAETVVGTVGERLQANRLALLSSLPDLHVLDVAQQPRTPATDLGPLVIALSLVTSFGLSVFGARARDRFDSRIRHPEQVTRDMQLTILACLPRVGPLAAGHRTQSSDEVIESLRGLRVRLLQARGNGPLCLTITSPSTGDGKSFLSVNLALSFAQAGYRTVLVDGDVRRGVQHRVLGASPRPGLVDVLAGTVTLGDAMQATSHQGLSLVSAGSRTVSAPELLTGSQLAETLEGLKATHDVIIVDSPPLAAGVDALVLAAMTVNLLVVLRSGITDLPLALAKLDVAAAHPVRLVGAVLNDIRGEGAFRYYAYDLTGYRIGEEIPADGQVRPRVLGGRP